ncbi:MAG: hypothetical protein J5J00_10740 [Deltaproteobacteria bacterium]|nr:hypothetical protein [Deltaproteobacteria bacterium]
MKRPALYCLLPLLLLVISTVAVAAPGANQEISARCNEWRKEACLESCEPGSKGIVRECYVDPKYYSKATWRSCYALHIAETCPPCKDLFATNYGGAFRPVSCEYFYEAIEKKNKMCGNCLQKMTHFQYDPSEIPFPK